MIVGSSPARGPWWVSAAALLVGCVGREPGKEPEDSPPVAVVDSEETDESPVVEGPVIAPTDWGGAFTDLSGPLQADIAVPELARAAAVWGDFERDGTFELITGLSSQGSEAAPSVQVWRYDAVAGAFSHEVALEARLQDGSLEPPLALYDLDGDLFLDTVHGGDAPFVRWGGSEGPGLPVPLDLGGVVPQTDLLSFAGVDLDGDGWTDLLVGASGCDTTLIPLMRVRGRELVPRRDLVGPDGGSRRVQAVLPVTWGTSGRRYLALGPACGAAGSAGSGLFEATDVAPGEEPRLSALPWAVEGAGWQGGGADVLAGLDASSAAAVDLEGDGDLDLVIASGLGRVIFLEQREGRWVDVSARAAWEFPAGSRPWSIGVADLDHDGRPDLLATADGPEGGPFVRAWWNNGDLRGADVTAAIGLDLAGHGWSLALADLEADGDVDIVVGGLGQAPRVLRNDLHPPWPGFSWRARGTVSNYYGHGAVLDVEVGTRSWRYAVGAVGGPGAVMQPYHFFGMGSDSDVQTDTLWPTGATQRISVTGGDLFNRTAEFLTFMGFNETRTYQQGRDPLIPLVVWPILPDGAVKAGAEIALATWGIPVAIDHVEATDDGGQRLWLRNPDVEGSTVIELRQDGQAFGVRPRLWWQASGP